MTRSPRRVVAAPVLVAAAVGLAMAATTPARAKGEDGATALREAALHGKEIFNHDRFGGSRTCAACHINGGVTAGRLPGGAKLPSLMGAAAQFPKYNARAHHVVTLTAQLDHCIRGGLGGTPPAATSAKMTDLIAYLTKLSQGAEMGKQFR